MPPETLWLSLSNRRIQRVLCLFGHTPWVFACFEREEERSKRENVRLVRVVAFLGADLWSHIRLAALHIIVQKTRSVRRSETPVYEAQVKGLTEAHVFWLDVSVSEPMISHVLHPVEKLKGHVADDTIVRERTGTLL